jgi:hypothetical protein
MLEELALVSSGACFFYGAFYVSARCVRNYGAGHVTRATSLKLSVRIVSCIQALLATAVGVYTASTCQDVLHERSFWLEKYVYFGLPYLIYDLHAMYYASLDEHGNNLKTFIENKGSIVIHHVALAVLGFPLIVFWRRGLGDFFVGCIFCAELSTVFLSLNMILKHLQMQESLWYGKYTGRLKMWEVPGQIPWFCSVGCGSILLLQLYWFHIIFVKTVKGLYSRILVSKIGLVKRSDSK